MGSRFARKMTPPQYDFFIVISMRWAASGAGSTFGAYSQFSPAPGVRAAVQVQNLPRDEWCAFKEEQRVSDLLRFPDPTERVQRSERAEVFRRVHRCADHTRCDSVHADSSASVFDGERPSDRIQAALGERRQRGG